MTPSEHAYPQEPDGAPTRGRPLAVEIVANLDRRTYRTKPLAQDDHASLWMSDTPTGAIYLVEVIGSTGDSLGSEDHTWSVDVFASLDEAEMLAETIDETYDMYVALRTFRPQVESGLAPKRAARLRDVIATMATMSHGEQIRLRGQLTNSFGYVSNGTTIRLAPPWQGHFETMTEVRILRLDPETQRIPKTFRRRR